MTVDTKDIVLRDDLMLVAGEIGAHNTSRFVRKMIEMDKAPTGPLIEQVNEVYEQDAVEVLKCLVAMGYEIKKKEPECPPTTSR